MPKQPAITTFNGCFMNFKDMLSILNGSGTEPYHGLGEINLKHFESSVVCATTVEI